MSDFSPGIKKAHRPIGSQIPTSFAPVAKFKARFSSICTAVLLGETNSLHRSEELAAAADSGHSEAADAARQLHWGRSRKPGRERVSKALTVRVPDPVRAFCAALVKSAAACPVGTLAPVAN